MLKCSSDFCCQVGHEGVDVDAGGGVTINSFRNTKKWNYNINPKHFLDLLDIDGCLILRKT